MDDSIAFRPRVPSERQTDSACVQCQRPESLGGKVIYSEKFQPPWMALKCSFSPWICEFSLWGGLLGALSQQSREKESTAL